MWCGIKKTGLVGVCALLISAWASAEQDAQSVAKALTALGHKLVALGHFNDMAVPRNQAADELEAVAKEFEALETDFKRLWLAEDRENEGFQELVKRFTYTIVPCREKAKQVQSP